MTKLLRRLVSEEEGQGMVEYALIIGLVAIVLIAAITGMQGGIAAVFDKIKTTLTGL